MTAYIKKSIIIVLSIVIIFSIGIHSLSAQKTTPETTNNVPVINNEPLDLDPCKGKDCYTLFSGFADALGNRFESIQNVDSLGGFINAVIAFGIGLGGVIAIAMIMYQGFLYMRTDSVTTKSRSKGIIINTLVGFVLLLSIYTLLRTINPDLLNLTPRIDALSLDSIPDRSNDTSFQDNLASLGGADVPIDTSDYSDPAFIMYLYHQQGEGGAPSILWAAKKGYSSVPTSTPFIKGNAVKINSNMANNVNKSDMQKILGTSEITPSNFLKYWVRKVKAAENSAVTIPNDINTAVSKASTDSGTSFTVMKTICRIESRCNRPAADTSNGQGYYGLFQLGKEVFSKFGKGGDILDYYANAYAGGKYAQYNITKFNNQRSKISE